MFTSTTNKHKICTTYNKYLYLKNWMKIRGIIPSNIQYIIYVQKGQYVFCKIFFSLATMHYIDEMYSKYFFIVSPSYLSFFPSQMGCNFVPCLWDASSWIFTYLFRWRRVFCFRLHFFSAQRLSWCLLFLLFAQCWNISKQDWWSASHPLHRVLLKVGLH